jgi:hypothetical protein
MESQDKRDEIPDPKAKAPYTRPELKRVGKLRDVTAKASGPSMDGGG